ncbi:serine O-acetyltransferase EpsC [Marinibactrum halimedae]|uniref:Serine acetyltransferase n=1 Tax=Marinibactrum halimedae TaxID=1444977 RepID=A0AA37TB86_9GAMM|nr:serine O-acetyltransferase EpsC [Marinibactrum halimedae]MCD9458981.1 serine O-acetyltransferase [Marinibactrum halimedae]GLS26890.1 serine acetyltransferase [Marinibactrum halimedae]
MSLTSTDIPEKASEALEDLSAIWLTIREEALAAVDNEPYLASFYHGAVLHHEGFKEAISFYLSSLLGSSDAPAALLRDVILEAMNQNAGIERQMLRDIKAWYDRDAACDQFIMPFLNFKGFHALQGYRIAHQLWREGRKPLAFLLHSRISEIFNVDIHPAATIGAGIMIDHATGVVIGETAVVEDEVSFLHATTLGGSGAAHTKRHPTVRRGVLVSAGVKVLGNIDIGMCAKLAAGSVVLESVPAYATVAGVPAKVVRTAKVSHTGADPAKTMDQCL